MDITGYWLMKTEPGTYSIDDLARDKREPWDGIRNYQARNFMRDSMKMGDPVIIYHSNATPPGAAGTATVASQPYPDPTAFEQQSKYFDPKSDPNNPRWMLVDVAFGSKFECLVPLTEMRKHPGLADLAVLRRGLRLSIVPIHPDEYHLIVGLGAG